MKRHREHGKVSRVIRLQAKGYGPNMFFQNSCWNLIPIIVVLRDEAFWEVSKVRRAKPS